MDTSPEAHDRDAIDIVGKILETGKGIIIICIKMYERIDESSMATLAMLHQKYGLRIWKHVVIVLTMADRYEEHKWLKLKLKPPKFEGSNSEFLIKKFRDEVDNRKNLLKTYCTDKTLQPSCCIGMTDEDEFNNLKIPVLPTSQLKKHEMDRMKQVDCGYWFDQLLIKCCQRVQGCALIQVHEKRLMKLPNKLMQQEVSGEMFNKLKKKKDAWENLFGIIYTWYQEYTYFKRVSTMSRLVWQPRPFALLWKGLASAVSNSCTSRRDFCDPIRLQKRTAEAINHEY